MYSVRVILYALSAVFSALSIWILWRIAIDPFPFSGLGALTAIILAIFCARQAHTMPD